LGQRPGTVESMGLNAAPLPDPAFWTGKRVLLTGHTGFKGSWTALWLATMGAKVTGYALKPDTDPALFQIAEVERDLFSIVGDLRDRGAVEAAVEAARPQVVIHMGAQALVRRSVSDPVGTFSTNVLGTVHLLDALRRRQEIEAILVVTSDKVYAHDGVHRAFVETDPLNGNDPYSASKAATEIVTRAYARSFFDVADVPLATARGGNIIGGGDFSDDRLVPDVVRSIRSGTRLALRHPAATRPWQHVLDCICGYLVFAQALASDRAAVRALNFAPESGGISVVELADALLAALKGPPTWDHAPDPTSIEIETLTLDASAARMQLGWRTRLTIEGAVRWTADWYRGYMEGEDPRALSLNQISGYRERAMSRK
jgi:CDP-glucose 4,6-dehydratase